MTRCVTSLATCALYDDTLLNIKLRRRLPLFVRPALQLILLVAAAVRLAAVAVVLAAILMATLMTKPPPTKLDEFTPSS